MRKRFLSLALVLTVCLALAAPACADRSGELGGGVYWLMDAGTNGLDGVLEFSGRGTITADTAQIQPDVLAEVQYIDVKDGITKIDDLAFAAFPNVKGIRISSTVTEIGDLFGTAQFDYLDTIFLYSKPFNTAYIYEGGIIGGDIFEFLDPDAYELGKTPYDGPKESCGENTTWSFNRETGTLTIGGTGATDDFSDGRMKPWAREENAMPEHVVVEEGVTVLGGSIFQDYFSIKTLSLPSTLTEIGESAFSFARGLTELTLPANLTKIGIGAFSHCASLTTVALPSGMTRVEMATFASSGLTSVSIPASVTYIDDVAFFGCDALTDVYYEGSAEQWAQIEIKVNLSNYKDTDTPNGKLSAVNIHYNAYTPAAPANPAAPGGTEPGGEATDFYIMPTASTVLVNGANVAFDAYNINGANYFKLRDLALAINGSAKQFEVSWDAAANAIALTSGAPYTAVGGELAVGASEIHSFQPTDSKIILDGTEVSLEAFNINGNNYFKLRDLGAAFNFGVDWDGANNAVVIDTTKGYTPDGV